MRNAESSQRGYLVTGNEIYLAPYDTAKAQSLRQLDALTRRINGDSQSAPMLRRLTAVINEKVGEMDQAIALKRERQGNRRPRAVPHQPRQGADG